MEKSEWNDGFGDGDWGGDLPNLGERPDVEKTDASEGSDFSPAQLAIIGRRFSTNAAPLPKGVEDIEWQPPTLTGLQHSDPIFETELDKRGTLCVSSKGFSSNNCHFRSWQEANGTVATFATETVEKEVDGHRMTVAIGRARRGPARKTSSEAAQRVSLVQSDCGVGTGAEGYDIERLRSLRRSSSAGDESRCDTPEPEERGVAAGPSVPSTDDAPNREGAPSMPQRPADGVASSHARQPRPGRSLSPKVC